MSRGLGKLQLGLLAKLDGGPSDVHSLACKFHGIETLTDGQYASARRAMASLVRTGRVVPLNVRRDGRKVFARPADAIEFYGLQHVARCNT